MCRNPSEAPSNAIINRPINVNNSIAAADSIINLNDSPAAAPIAWFRASCYSTFMIQEAWTYGNIAHYNHPLSARRMVGYQFLHPTLHCDECCFHTGHQLLAVGDKDYLLANQNTTRWYDGNFISSFSSLAAHYAHIKDSDWEVLHTKLMHNVYQREELCKEACQPLPKNVKRVIGVLHKNGYYSVMEIDVEAKVVRIYDGLNWPMLRWFDHIIHAVKWCKLIQ